jgi:hypothetical protein
VARRERQFDAADQGLATCRAIQKECSRRRRFVVIGWAEEIRYAARPSRIRRRSCLVVPPQMPARLAFAAIA